MSACQVACATQHMITAITNTTEQDWRLCACQSTNSNPTSCRPAPVATQKQPVPPEHHKSKTRACAPHTHTHSHRHERNTTTRRGPVPETVAAMMSYLSFLESKETLRRVDAHNTADRIVRKNRLDTRSCFTCVSYMNAMEKTYFKQCLEKHRIVNGTFHKNLYKTIVFENSCCKSTRMSLFFQHKMFCS